MYGFLPVESMASSLYRPKFTLWISWVNADAYELASS